MLFFSWKIAFAAALRINVSSGSKVQVLCDASERDSTRDKRPGPKTVYKIVLFLCIKFVFTVFFFSVVSLVMTTFAVCAPGGVSGCLYMFYAHNRIWKGFNNFLVKIFPVFFSRVVCVCVCKCRGLCLQNTICVLPAVCSLYPRF